MTEEAYNPLVKHHARVSKRVTRRILNQFAFTGLSYHKSGTTLNSSSLAEVISQLKNKQVERNLIQDKWNQKWIHIKSCTDIFSILLNDSEFW